jgi:hypothetical protein
LINHFSSLAIFEFEFHNEVLANYVHHFLPLSSKVMVFTNEFNFNQSRKWRDNPKIKWFVEQKNTEISDILIKHAVELTHCQIIILTSLPEVSRNKTTIKFPCPVWFVIHNLHTTFGKVSNHYYIGNEWCKDILKVFRYLFIFRNKNIKTVLNKVENIIFPSENINEYYHKIKPDNRFPSPIIIPFSRFVKPVIPLENEVFRMVVPGSITMYTRDYQLLYEGIRLVLSATNRKISLILLGKPRDSTCVKILEKMLEMTSVNFAFQYFTEYVDQEVFDNILSQTNIILAPLQKVTRFGVYRELYGYSTESGNIADIIRYGIPGIIPDFYPVPVQVDFLFKKYRNTQDFSKVILEFIKNNQQKVEEEKLHYFSSEQVSLRILEQWTKTHSKMDKFAHD